MLSQLVVEDDGGARRSHFRGRDGSINPQQPHSRTSQKTMSQKQRWKTQEPNEKDGRWIPVNGIDLGRGQFKKPRDLRSISPRG
jgi:hypothetical protein